MEGPGEGGMSVPAESISSEWARLEEAGASFTTLIRQRFSCFWAERYSASSNAPHISSVHLLQVLQGVFLVQKMPTPRRQVLQDGWSSQKASPGHRNGAVPCCLGTSLFRLYSSLNSGKNCLQRL